jgi:hypothetical protein
MMHRLSLPRDADDDARAETHPAPTTRSILRQLVNDTYAYIMLWVVLAFAAQVLGRELPDSAVQVIALTVAGFVVLDATRLALRRRCASRAIRP